MRQVAGVLLEGDDILLAEYLIRHGIRYLQRMNGGAVDVRALALHHQFAAEAARNQPAQVSVAAGSAEADAVVVVANCLPQRMAAQVAAARLGVTDRAVRNWCQAGALAGRKQGGRWQIEEWSVTVLAAARRKGA
jgi:hypothetical protein